MHPVKTDLQRRQPGAPPFLFFEFRQIAAGIVIEALQFIQGLVIPAGNDPAIAERRGRILHQRPGQEPGQFGKQRDLLV